MVNIPKVKKVFRSFLLSEEGKITKNSIIRLGTLALTASFATVESSRIVAACHGSGVARYPTDLPECDDEKGDAQYYTWNCGDGGKTLMDLDSYSDGDKICHGHNHPTLGCSVTHANSDCCIETRCHENTTALGLTGDKAIGTHSHSFDVFRTSYHGSA